MVGGHEDKDSTMKCVICKHGDTQPGLTTLTLTRDSLTLVVKNVPARVCENCGEAFVDEDVAARVLNAAEEAVRAGVQVEVREYVAA
jgi:YgiT-type zinc finger domain-containing protein